MKMKFKDHIYVLFIDEQFDATLKKFEDELEENEQIVSQSVAQNRLIITTRKQITDAYGRPSNLLLEEIKERNQK